MDILGIQSGLSEGRKLLTLLAVTGAAAGLYVWGETANRDARNLAVWGDLVCAEANSEFRTEDQKKRHWGNQCRLDIKRLAQIENDLQASSLDALLRDLERRDGKAAADAALAAALARRAAEAAERMEIEDASVSEDDRVGGSWGCAVNDVGGLRSHGC